VFPRRSTPPKGLPFTSLLDASIVHVPPPSFPNVISHSFWVTPLDLKVLSRVRVRCIDTSLPTCPCPILPWAFQTSVHRCPSTVRSHPKIGPKPGRTLQRFQLKSFLRPHVLQAPQQSPQPKLCPLLKSLASGLRFPTSSPPSKDRLVPTRLRRNALTSLLNPPPCDRASGKPLSRSEQKS
jgi:hypothetical protein